MKQPIEHREVLMGDERDVCFKATEKREERERSRKCFFSAEKATCEKATCEPTQNLLCPYIRAFREG